MCIKTCVECIMLIELIATHTANVSYKPNPKMYTEKPRILLNRDTMYI